MNLTAVDLNLLKVFDALIAFDLQPRPKSAFSKFNRSPRPQQRDRGAKIPRRQLPPLLPRKRAAS